MMASVLQAVELIAGKCSRLNCSSVPRNWLPLESTICRRSWCSRLLVNQRLQVVLILKPAVGGTPPAYHGIQCLLQNSLRPAGLRSVRGSSRKFAGKSYLKNTAYGNFPDAFGINESGSGQHPEESEQNLGGEGNGEFGNEEMEDSSEAEANLKPGLYLVGTPIGNLEDITLRALRVLKSATLILAEDTRHSSRLLRHYDIRTPAISYHKFNEMAREDLVLERLRRGEVLALISDAGMPGISDPGSAIVRACVEANVDVFPIPGPSAVVTALVASGLPTEEFSFVGFLPAQSSSRQKRLAIAASESATQVFYVPPHKLIKILEDCISAFGSSRRCAVARELTKLHEEFWRGSLDQALTEFKTRSARGEITLIIEGVCKESQHQLVDEDELRSRLRSLLDAGKSPSEATKQVVLETSARKNLVYPLALSMIQKQKF
ncbi:hypothetical protein R1sor_020902 [Riccia sorocarpa]|uniref:Tetrapyrrole methylase domain-containing protein n=1 Tax=Riccia sorocarpa TaxID=122646 RepID=A0ABD3GGZ0_9MARC